MPRQPILPLVLDRRKDASLQAQLAVGLKALIRSGVLRPGAAVPSTRELARDQRISRNTVIQTYDRLIGEGYLEAAPRRGLFVSAVLARTSPRAAARTAPPRLPDAVDRLDAPVPFRPCQPDVRLFPLRLWNRLRARVLRSNGVHLLHYQSQLTFGLPGLRRSLATYLRESRGVQCDWRQIAVTNGSQQALYLLASLLLKPGSRVLMEDPGYLGARAAWMQAGATIEPVAVDAEGMRIPAEQRVPAPLVYTTPSRQFPTGACLSLSRRLALIEFAARNKAWIVEDDYDSEFRYSRPPLPSLQSLDTSGRVIYVGSMSKVLVPSLRLGFVVLPPPLVARFAELRAVLDDHGPLIDQATLAEFIESGALFTHIRRCRSEYARRLDALVESAQRQRLPLTFPHTDGGMNLAGFFADPDCDDEKHARRLRRAGFDVPSLSHYSLQRSQAGLVLGFTAFEAPEIRDSIRRLGQVLSRRQQGAGRVA
jgi:GntR family transcriptional regulator/MocR family aminotransferase